MDLRTVKEELLGGNYNAATEFVKDMRLIFTNSRNYNTNKRSRVSEIFYNFPFIVSWRRDSFGGRKPVEIGPVFKMFVWIRLSVWNSFQIICFRLLEVLVGGERLKIKNMISSYGSITATGGNESMGSFESWGQQKLTGQHTKTMKKFDEFWCILKGTVALLVTLMFNKYNCSWCTTSQLSTYQGRFRKTHWLPSSLADSPLCQKKLFHISSLTLTRWQPMVVFFLFEQFCWWFSKHYFG